MKIGMVLGLILVTAVMLWIFVGPGINLKAKALKTESELQNYALPEISDSTNSTEIEVRQENNQLSSNDEQSEEPDLTKNWQPEKIKTQRFHIIREGETLSEISRDYYGSATKWQKIFDANRHLIQDVSKLKPGTKIIVPE